MINICILHCARMEIQATIDVIRNYNITVFAKLFIVINPEYELDYLVRHKDMDIIILDACFMCNGYDGIFLAKRIKVFNRKVLIIFISETTDKKQLINIINAEPFAYIKLKDILTKLPLALNDAISIVSKDISIFTYFKKNEQNSIPLKKVIYFSSSHRIIKYICIDGREDYFYDKMDNTEKVIINISHDFIRVNQSYLINRKFIISLIGNEITMINNHVITISRKYHDSKHILDSHMSR